jgi:hypothetical protein
VSNGSEMKLAYDVRLYKTEVYQGKRRTSYRVRWAVAGVSFKEVLHTKKLAESFLAKLTTASREGIPFDTRSGLPATMAKDLNRRSWFLHACEYIDMSGRTSLPDTGAGSRRR